MNNKKMGKKNKKGTAKKEKQDANPIGKAPTFTKQANVEDFLDETDMKSHERFGCIMFASPGESMREHFKEQIAAETGIADATVTKIVERYIELEHPKRAFKYVGGRSTPEECTARIKQVMTEEPSFHIFTMENGKWCTFDPSPELIQDENYREEQLNEIIKGSKLAEEKTKDFFRSEMRKKVEKARLEGTKEGQQILLEAEEPYQAVQYRAENAERSIQELRAKILEMERTKSLAEEKMQKYRDLGKDKVDPREETEKKLEGIKEQAKTSDETTRERLSELQAIERQTVIEAGTSQALVQRMGGPSSELFEDTPIIPNTK